MPSGPRIRTDNVYGTLTAAIDDDDTTLSSAGLADLAAVSSAHAIIVLDPLRTAGAPEVVFVTAHTGSATSATVTRGGYGTTARSHDAGVLWVHAPTVEDTIRIVTSGTRPSDPYEGQLIYETDTNRYASYDAAAWLPGGFVTVCTSSTRPASPFEGQTIYETDTDSYKGYNGSAWEHVMSLGAMPTWSPVVTQSNTPTQTVNRARYSKVGRWVRAEFDVGFSAAGTASNAITVTGLPVTAATAASINGSFHYFDAGNTIRAGSCVGASTTSVQFHYDGFGARMGQGDFAIASSDALHGCVTYEAAS